VHGFNDHNTDCSPFFAPTAVHQHIYHYHHNILTFLFPPLLPVRSVVPRLLLPISVVWSVPLLVPALPVHSLSPQSSQQWGCYGLTSCGASSCVLLRARQALRLPHAVTPTKPGEAGPESTSACSSLESGPDDAVQGRCVEACAIKENQA